MDSSTTTTTTAPPADPVAVRRAITNLDPTGVIGAQLDCVVTAVIAGDVEENVPGGTAAIAAASPGQVPMNEVGQRYVQFVQSTAASVCDVELGVAFRPAADGHVIVFEAR